MKKKVFFVVSFLMIFALVACAAPAETPVEEAAAKNLQPAFTTTD